MELIQTENFLIDKDKHAKRIMKFENAQFINVQMKKDEVLSEHYTRERAIIIVRKGRVKFNFGEDTVIVTNENIFSMEPSEVHDVLALEDTDFMIIKVI